MFGKSTTLLPCSYVSPLMLLMWGVISDSQSQGHFRLNISLQPLKGALKIRVWTRLSTGRQDGRKSQTDNSLNSALFFWNPPDIRHPPSSRRYRQDRKIFISQWRQQGIIFSWFIMNHRAFPHLIFLTFQGLLIMWLFPGSHFFV